MFWDNNTVTYIRNSSSKVCPYTARAGDVWSNSPGLSHGEAVSASISIRWSFGKVKTYGRHKVKVYKSDTI